MLSLLSLSLSLSLTNVFFPAFTAPQNKIQQKPTGGKPCRMGYGNQGDTRTCSREEVSVSLSLSLSLSLSFSSLCFCFSFFSVSLLDLRLPDSLIICFVLIHQRSCCRHGGGGERAFCVRCWLHSSIIPAFRTPFTSTLEGKRIHPARLPQVSPEVSSR